MEGFTLHSPGARVQAQLRFSQEHPKPHEHKGNRDFDKKDGWRRRGQPNYNNDHLQNAGNMRLIPVGHRSTLCQSAAYAPVR